MISKSNFEGQLLVQEMKYTTGSEFNTIQRYIVIEKVITHPY